MIQGHTGLIGPKDIYKDLATGSSFFNQPPTGQQQNNSRKVTSIGFYKPKYLVYRLAECYFTY